jgi:hypothetical protein
MAKVKATVAAGFAAGVLVSNVGNAADAAFENHLTSSPMVSPAQLYQTKELKTDFSLGFDSASGSTKGKGATSGAESEETVKATDFFAGAIYNVQGVGLRTGLTVNLSSVDKEDEIKATATPTATNKTEATDMTVTVPAAYQAGPVVAGIALQMVQRTEKPEVGEELKRTYNRVRPAVLFANNDLEAGLVYVSPTNLRDEQADKKADVVEPAEVTAHGRFAISRDMAAGGIITNVNYKGIDEDAFKDRQSVKGTFEMGAGPVKVESDLAYNTAFHKNDDSMNEATISTVALGAAADYNINKDAAVGGALGYEFGSDENDTGKYERNLLSLAVRGNMKF